MLTAMFPGEEVAGSVNYFIAGMDVNNDGIITWEGLFQVMAKQNENARK
jgi:hypothetical protein